MCFSVFLHILAYFVIFPNSIDETAFLGKSTRFKHERPLFFKNNSSDSQKNYNLVPVQNPKKWPFGCISRSFANFFQELSFCYLKLPVLCFFDPKKHVHFCKVKFHRKKSKTFIFCSWNGENEELQELKWVKLCVSLPRKFPKRVFDTIFASINFWLRVISKLNFKKPKYPLDCLNCYF